MNNKFMIAASICTVFLLSCGESEFEADGRKMAKLICKEQQLSAKAADGDEAAKIELENVTKERKRLKEEHLVKYYKNIGEEKMRKKAREIIEEELAKCK